MAQTRTKPAGSARARSDGRRSAKASEVLTLAEAAAYLRVTEAEVLRLVREQGLPGRSVGEGWRFLKAAVAAWLGATATPAGAFWQTHFGALEGDPYLAEIVREAYRRRGRPED